MVAVTIRADIRTDRTDALAFRTDFIGMTVYHTPSFQRAIEGVPSARPGSLVKVVRLGRNGGSVCSLTVPEGGWCPCRGGSGHSGNDR